MSAAREIEDRAAAWLIRSEDAAWSPTDQAALDAWLAESMAHKAAYWRLEHGWREADRIGALGLSNEKLRPVGTPWLSARRKPIAIAASIVAVLAVGSLEMWPTRRTEAASARFDTPVGGRRTISLADGSKVELNTATEIRTAAREVWLDKGEAYFEVMHMDAHPFVVHAGSRTVTVLGTKFAVRRDADKVTVSVIEGRVRVDDGASAGSTSRSSIITAGDTAIARGPATLLAARSEERVESALAWRDGMLSFDQTTLGDAAAEFNRYNRKPIVVTDPAAAAIRIGGTFQASNVDAFVRLLRDAYGLRVTTDDDAVKISS
jgi:transmembrane sensor